MIIEPFTLKHYEAMKVQDAQRYIGDYVSDHDVRSLMQHDAFAGVLDDGTVVGACGMYEQWAGRASVWALLSCSAGDNFIQVHRAVARFLDMQSYRRIEATVECDFTAGHRWMEMLGFKKEAERMESYDPDGRPHALYARTR